jgi:chromosome segregation ATPase
MKQSQELIQRHQKRLQEVQRQLAQIQQQQQKLQEAQRQLMQQQQYQRQMIQKQTFVNRSNSQVLSQSKFKGFAEVSQINNNYKNQQQQYNNQINQSQTLTNTSQQYLHQNSSQSIKQTKTSINQNANTALRTQTSSPISFQTPSLQNYQNQSSKNSLDDEISEQQIALAQMASMQNQENPNYQNLQAITLQQREEELQPEQEETQEQVQEEAETQQVEAEEQTQEGEQMDIEALFMTEEGRIIFRNGRLRGIIHKYAEIDDVISKIQDILLKGVKFNLVYKAFDVGDKAETFHKKCDKLNMSLVLIETDNDVRFGGFTTKSWEGNNIKKKDNNAFVFNLDTNSIFDVIKNEPAIGCYPKFGPVFFGCQIRIYDEFFTKGGTTCHKGLNYKTKKDYELNNGEQKYLIKDIEIYSIEAIDI